jgi:ArsR family transcriptional regulator, virulence genes transcriptional regulator
MKPLFKDQSFADFEENATEAANLMKALGNEKRLMILCKLLEAGEMNVMALCEAVGLSQSALSQHLAKMRAEKLVDYRRASQTLFYRVADPNVKRIVKTLKSIFC